jgi:rRNA maturation RNase YbeY
MPSTFHEQDVSARLKLKRKLSSFIDGLMRQHLPAAKRTQLTYVFCTDEALLAMNKQFLNHDTLTDIITFDLSESDDEITSELYISTERVAENAQLFNATYEHELLRVIFHGALHLCGFKDKTDAEAQLMRAAEEASLEAWYKQ